MNALLSSLSKFFLLAVGVTMLMLFGCKETNTVTGDSVITTRDALTDPNVSPAVVWTFPTNNSVGPYTAFNTSTHYFTVQFNKMMNVYTFNSTTVKIKGFSQTVYVTADYNYNNPPPQFQNIIKFYVRVASNYNSMNFEIGKTYTVEIDSTVEDLHGKRLGKKYSFTFTPEPSFRIRYVYPFEGDTLTEIQNYYPYNPMVSFNSTISQSSLASLHVTPSVAGKWNIETYSNTSNAYFVPSVGFDFDNKYKITVDQGMKDAKGNTLPQMFTSTFITSAFKVVSTTPQDGAIDVYPSSNMNITVNFSGDLDYASVVSAFSITPTINGSMNVNRSQISFYTNDQLIPGTKYTVKIDTTVRAKNGAKLLKPYTFSFTTEEFRVTNAEPYYGSSDVSPNSQIRFSFNSAIDAASAISAFSIEPAIEGNFSFQYYDNRTFIFTPTQPLKHGTLYKVTLSTTMKSANGGALKTPYELQFTTTPFRVTYTDPSNNGYEILPNYIVVNFSGALDTGTVRNSFSISPSISGYFEFSSYYTDQFLFHPTQSFVMGQKYTVTLSTGIKAKDGSSLSAPYTFSFTTPTFKVIGSSPSNGSTYVYRWTNIFINTNASVNYNSIPSAFSISPTVTGTFSNTSNGFYFYPQNQLAANTQYTVTVSTKLKNTVGDTLKTPWTFSFTTGQ